MPEDPLAQLKDLHLPEASGWWPPAPGWWLLLLILLLSPLLWCGWCKWRSRQATPHYQRAALEELDQLYQGYRRQQDGAGFVQSVSALLKRVALQCYPQQEVASLSGRQWGEFLGRGLGEEEQRHIVEVLDRVHSKHVEADAEAFFHFARQWIEAQETF